MIMIFRYNNSRKDIPCLTINQNLDKIVKGIYKL